MEEIINMIYRISFDISRKQARLNSGFLTTIDYEDCAQEACIYCLPRMVEYDPNKGALTTFLWPKVFHAVTRHIQNNCGIIRIPVNKLKSGEIKPIFAVPLNAISSKIYKNCIVELPKNGLPSISLENQPRTIRIIKNKKRYVDVRERARRMIDWIKSAKDREPLKL